MENLFYVGVYLAERVHFKEYGFTSYVDGFVNAETPGQAGKFAAAYFENTFKVAVTGTRPQKADGRYARPEMIIKPPVQFSQTTLSFERPKRQKRAVSKPEEKKGFFPALFQTLKLFTVMPLRLTKT